MSTRAHRAAGLLLLTLVLAVAGCGGSAPRKAASTPRGPGSASSSTSAVSAVTVPSAGLTTTTTSTTTSAPATTTATTSQTLGTGTTLSASTTLSLPTGGVRRHPTPHPASTTGPPPPTGVPLNRVLADAPQLDRALVWPGPVRASAASLCSLTATADRAGTRIGSIVQVRADEFVVVHSRPGGPVVDELAYRTDSGDNERAFTVYAVRDSRWLGVSVPALGGHLGWILADPARLTLEPARYEIRVSLPRRELWLLRDGDVVLHTPVVIGAPSSPTPPGQYSVDDKLRYSPPSPAYGIGALALSVAPRGLPWRLWRVAIHGLNNLGQLGGTGSEGCVHVPRKALATLLARVPIGTPVDIQA